MPNQLSDEAPSAVLDLDHLRRQTFDDRDLAAELLALFARQARDIMGSLSDGTAAAPCQRADLLHALCGSARAVGAWDVARHAETLERQQRLADSGTLELRPLGRAVALACDAIDRWEDR